MQKKIRLGLVMPCYNEEAVLPITLATLNVYFEAWQVEGWLAPESKMCFVDDGSRDQTWALIEQAVRENPNVLGLKLAANFGHQNAILAGMLELEGAFDCLITLDADLQDDPHLIRDMVASYQNGHLLVYAVRNDRETDAWFKRATAQGFYRLMRGLGVNVVYNHADYRLIDDRVLGVLRQYQEVHLFLRGLFPLMGFPHDFVYFKRQARAKGTSKYPLKKMLGFAWNGITSFSAYPMKLILGLGFLVFGGSLAGGIWALFAFFQGHTVPGWTSILIPLLLFGGLQMMALGIIGEYVGKIYMEVKARPRYIVEKQIGGK